MSFARDLRECYYSGENFNELCSTYMSWVKRCEYLVFWKESNSLDEKNEYVCFKTLKRGNDVYCSRVRRSLKSLIDLCSLYDDIVFINEKSQRYAYTNFLFITLTYDRRVNSLENAWLNIGRELHLFLTKVRKVYGNFKVLRCFEAYSSDGYPHVHILMLFTDKVFLVRRHSYRTKKGNIATKYLLDGYDRKTLGEYWHSFIDVTGVKSFYSVRYILKYITKKMYFFNKGLTSVCMLIFRKRSYSISKDFVDMLGSFLEVVICRLDLNTHNCNIDIKEYEYLGVFVSPFPINDWFYNFKAEEFNEIFNILGVVAL